MTSTSMVQGKEGQTRNVMFKPTTQYKTDSLEALKDTEPSGHSQEMLLSGKATLCFDIWTCPTAKMLFITQMLS